MTDPSLTFRPLADLAASLRDGSLTSAEICDAAIANHDAVGETLAAYKSWDPGKVRAEAAAADAAFKAGLVLGPMQGIPVSAKDLYGVSGYQTFAGTPKALAEKWQAEGPVVSALRQGLSVFSGKTHTVEFAFGGMGTNAHWGAPRNPWDAEAHRAPGGSSSGAGVSLWEGSALIALGTDTAGSVRLPASFNGCVGIKTTFGRWSLDGIVPLSPSLDTAGVLARSAADAAYAFATIDPETPEPPEAFLAALQSLGLTDFRIGYCEALFAPCEPQVAKALEDAVSRLKAAGLDLVPFDLPEIPEVQHMFRYGGLAAPEFAAFINGEMSDYKATLDPNVSARFEKMEQIPAIEYIARKKRLAELSASANDRFDAVDVVLSPTTAITPPTIDKIATPETYFERNMAALTSTAIVNMLTLCAVSVPAGLDSFGIPVGLHIMAPGGEDERALAAALAIEAALGGPLLERHGKPPLAPR